MGIKDLYQIRPIPYKLAMRMVVQNHYLHRKAPCSFAFGLFDKEAGEFIGVITYGTPSSAPLRRGICGDSEKNNVIELTRLWVKDGTPKNTESFFIGNTIKKIDKEIVVSFAEISAGHKGVVYQATNWLYTGLSAKRTDWTIEGVSLHGQTLADRYTSEQIREYFGDRFSLKERPRKHRYIYFNAKGARRKELMLKLKYPLLPYP
jgi:hypothetical protein